MAKYSRDLSEDLVEKVNTLARNYGLKELGVNIDVARMESDKEYGKVLLPNDAGKLSSNQKNLVFIALNEELFDMLEDAGQNILINNLLEQVFVSEGKEGGEIKIRVEKPQLNVGLRTYHDYGDAATKTLETVILSLDMLAEQKKAEKEAKAQQKRGKKNKNANF